ncbi:MAG: thioredoxin-disulfide reductase [Deltaproteobacteria bacterium]|nr:thioredoxin-disulfide reductase [Deltaproteobacteria bacterium]
MSSTPPELHDLIILGGGAAGTAAGVYAGRGRLDTLVLDAMGGGGQMNIIDTIENYPGLTAAMPGPELARQMREQMERFGASLTFDQAESVEADDDTVSVTGAYGRYRGRALIVATGARHRELCVPGEERLQGRGVSYCATCDGAFFAGQRVALIGGGDSAVKEALFLSRIVDHVTVIHRRDRLRAEQVMQERAFEADNIDFAWSSVVTEILGEEKVAGVRLRQVDTGEQRTLDVGGVFVFVGVLPNTEFLGGLIDLDEGGFIVTDIDMRTSHPRIFAAGDVRARSVRQIATAVGDGTTAVLNIQQMLDTETPPRDLARVCEVEP